MQHLDEHMDELFQKAAAEYPLKTGADDWDKVAPLVAGMPAAAPVPRTHTRRNIISGVLLLLLAVVFSVCMLFNFSTGIIRPKLVSSAAVIPPVMKPGLNTSGVSRLMQAGSGAGVRGPIHTVRKDAGAKEQEEASGKKLLASRVQPVFRQDMPGGAPESLVMQPAHRIPVSADTLINPQNDKHGRKPVAGFYIGIQGGLQMNEISGQGFARTGLSAGLQAGYRFSKKVSVETGFRFSKKYYHSMGDYFDMTKMAASMPPNMTLLSMNGSITAFEIPVRIKYDFAGGLHSNWFVSSGVSSFLVIRENNDYRTMVNGTPQNFTGHYPGHAGYIPAAADFSIGYEWRITKKTMLRIEPYWQIPLKGIGMGSIQVMTTGIGIGFIHPFHQ